MDDTRRIFLDIDGLSRWDQATLFQRFPMAERVPITGLEPGPAGSWDARGADYPCVLYEDGLFRMWYSCMPDAEDYGENADHAFTCYAESDDGVTWRKPDLRITGQSRYPGNNLLALPGFCMGVVRALPGSEFRYLAASMQIMPLEPGISDVPGNSYDGGGSGRSSGESLTGEAHGTAGVPVNSGVPREPPTGGGTFIFGSQDGLRWRQLARVCRHGDCASLFADAPSGRYLLYQKVGLMHGMHMRRSFIGLESRDGVSWDYTGIPYGAHTWRECFVADDYDDLIAAQRGFRISDYYGVTIHRVGPLYVAIENIFTIGPPLVPYFGQNPSGLCHFRLGFSHNAFNWRRPAGRPPWLELGAPGEFDAGFMVPGLNLAEHGDEMLLYYAGTPYEHGWCINPDFTFNRTIPLSEQRDTLRIGLVKIKRDRFASLAATYKGRFDIEPDSHGSEPLFISPRRSQLFVNARCPNGAIRVAIAERGKTDNLHGFSFEDCIPFTGDSVRAPMRFRKASTAGIPPDKPVYLRFEVSRGEIFGYEWGSPGQA